MTREALEKLIDDGLLASFAAMNKLDPCSNYKSSYLELMEKWATAATWTKAMSKSLR